MHSRSGPFYKLYPSVSVTTPDFRWCYLWHNVFGELVAIEWLL